MLVYELFLGFLMFSCSFTRYFILKLTNGGTISPPAHPYRIDKRDLASINSNPDHKRNSDSNIEFNINL